MKIIKTILIFLLWLLYAIFTVNARNRYMYGKSKGMYCSEAKQDLFGTDLTLHPSIPPMRDYVTFKEFFTQYKNWINGKK